MVGYFHRDVCADDSAQTRGNGGFVALPVTGVGHNDDVGFQELLVGVQEGFESGGTDFFFAFDK